MNATPKVRPPAVPIEILSSDAAKFYTHIHPILVLSLYAYKFPSIVADPVPALLSSLIPLAILQIVFVAICLPPTGSSTVVVEKKKPGEKKKAPESPLSRKIIVRSPTTFLSYSALGLNLRYLIELTDNCYSLHFSPSYSPSSSRPPSSPPPSSSSARRSARTTSTRYSAQLTSRFSQLCHWYTCTVWMDRRGERSSRCCYRLMRCMAG